MKSRILKALAIAGVAAFTFATPAAAVTISFEIAGSDLRVVASDLGTDIIAAFDMNINYGGGLTVNSVFTDNQLGISNVDTIFDSILSAGLVDAAEVSFLTDSDLDLRQTTPTLTLLTIRFDQQDISNGGFTFTWDVFNDVKCANNRVCFPPALVPEPGTLALLALGILGAAVGRRRRAA